MPRVPAVLFARAPVPGRCKTRLAAAIGGERAAALYAAFVTDTLARLCADPALAPELHVTEDHPFLAALSVRFELPPPRRQAPGGLGARMQRALDRGEHVLLAGSDAPSLTARILAEARASLERHDVVLTPPPDGGFPVIGSAGRAPTSFLRSHEIRWSSRHALADTMRAARAAGLSVALTAPAYDVDEPRDLALLATHLALDPALAPPPPAPRRGAGPRLRTAQNP